MKQKTEPLNGTHNKRLNNVDLRNNQNTFPLVDTAARMKSSHTTIPPEEDVIHAKEWIDDGSQL